MASRPTGTALTAMPVWQALVAHHAQVEGLHLRALFADDPGRAARSPPRAPVCSSTTRRTGSRTRPCASCCSWRRRAAWRNGAMPCSRVRRSTRPSAAPCFTWRCGRPGAPASRSMAPTWWRTCTRCWMQWPPSPPACAAAPSPVTGRRIRNVVNIGIGGSFLGPEMAYRALRAFSDRSMTFRFVANVDGADFSEATSDLDAAETCSSCRRRPSRRSRR